MKLDYSYPKLKYMEKWAGTKRNLYPPEDGLDEAYFDGIEVVLKVLKKWDGGISESYLEGIRDVLNAMDNIENQL